ncbi:endonuclease/exonuclease/phosphatase family protein [Streptomyces sp. NPDC005438]|uniref:endonuclease/exonuclease/phosphatase family protein n=1 Tax=Streptomyces sp. NPDC005438 TaxID=3156880 RepID=UPI0033B0BF2C
MAEAARSTDPDTRRGHGGRRFLGRWDRPGIWRRGLVIAGCALLLGIAMSFHSKIPNSIGNLGSLWETFLPWGGLAILPLLVAAVLRRSVTALVATLVPVLVWFNLFGGLLSDKSGSGGDLVLMTHNVSADNPDPKGTARQLLGSDADVIALQELATSQVARYQGELRARYPYHVVQGTVGVWSKTPLRDTHSVDIRMGWPRAMRTTVTTPSGELAVYVAHLPSVRVEFRSGFTAGQRDRAAQALGDAIAQERVDRKVLMGDLNGTMNDRALAPVTSQMRSTEGAAGDGFGFSWPSSFPMARIDQIMVRGVEPVSSWTLPGTGSDHLPVAASVQL